MNGTASQLIRRFARFNNFRIREVKRYWNSLPWNQRHSFRLQMQESITQKKLDLNFRQAIKSP
jgi:hypothetical protein